MRPPPSSSIRIASLGTPPAVSAAAAVFDQWRERAERVERERDRLQRERDQLQRAQERLE